MSAAAAIPQIINVLIDWDNVHPLWRNRGVAKVVAACISRIGAANVRSAARIKVRLYGGWFRETAISRVAQQLIPQIEGDYPQLFPVWAGIRTTVEVELARSLAEAPSITYTHTYRERGLPGTLTCLAPPYSGCKNAAACPARTMRDILASGACTSHGCEVAVASIVTKAEQKLVDTMLAVDMLHFSRFKSRCIVLVTSDDDLFPAIHAAILRGATVVHLHPNPGRMSPLHYSRHLMGDGYISKSFEAET